MSLLLLFIPFILIGIHAAYKNTRQVNINRIDVGATKYTERPLHILHISDMHLENISITADELHERLKGESFDLIALTGDFLDRKWTIPKLVPYLEVFQRLAPVHGIYAVFGNHDYVLRPHNFEKLKSTLQAYGCQTLQNEQERLMIDGRQINIVGIDDYSTGRSDLEASFKEVEEGYTLVLTHDPNVVLEMAGYHFDYLLSGHFHGGQILYPKAYHLAKMGKLPRMDMVKGLQNYQGKAFYISEGLGQTGLNIRVGSRPEITMHQLAE
ncbi:metallophosphoesterase [Thalassobacillus pellis]|uniref:metallophosphoesterase n=1 Tax=Thalassobacillus pellis TaxID=748008 RepID=UPI00308429B8|nr:putative MPP superfamily phosphohydrolase [Thalassobacillus pellis]